MCRGARKRKDIILASPYIPLRTRNANENLPETAGIPLLYQDDKKHG